MIKHKQPQINNPSGDSGFTIIESLVALLVAGALLAAVAPALVISTATRLQARRVELAAQASKTFIDGLKSGAVDITKLGVVELDTDNTNLNKNLLSNSNMPVPTDKTQLFCVERDQNNFLNVKNPGQCTNNVDFYIQATQIKAEGATATDGYIVGLRVYRSDFTSAKASNNLNPQNSARTFTGGLGDKNAPLIETTTTIASRSTSFNDLCQRLRTNITRTNTNCN